MASATRVDDPTMPLSKYACDSCRLSKVTCSREQPRCEKCTHASRHCEYSRSGVIRRKNKTLKRRAAPTVHIAEPPPPREGSDPEDQGPRSHLAVDIDAAQDAVENNDRPGNERSIDALLTLSEVCSASDFAARGQYSRSLFLFEDHAAEWTQIFENSIRKATHLKIMVPEEVLVHLRDARPHLIQKKGWLVIFYCTILQTRPDSITLRDQLQHNLWLSLGDVRVLLEPTELNIRALLTVLKVTSDLVGPSLCWMLATSACRMHLALDVSGRRGIDPAIRVECRSRFWHLNLLDKALALTFGRPPTFHQGMVKQIGLPTVEQLHGHRLHSTRLGTCGFFGLHMMYQKVLLSNVMNDIWEYLHGGSEPDDQHVERIIKGLMAWYKDARKVLDAAALTEKPFCDVRNARAIDIGLRVLKFHYLYLAILLTRSSESLTGERIDVSKQMLKLLPDLAPSNEEPYHPLLWQLICCPFTPFLGLFCDIISGAGTGQDGHEEMLMAMEHLPPFMSCLAPRNKLAAKLEDIANVLIRHARSVVSSPRQASPGRNDASSPRPPSEGASARIDSVSGSEEGVSHWALLDFDVHADWAGYIEDFTSNMGKDGQFDWLNWETQMSTDQGPIRGDPAT